MPVFVDANVLVYARDASEPGKQPQAAARIAGCGYLLTEDLQHGAKFEGLRVVNPFHVAAGSLG